jgi:Cu+-exporting ATPase
MIGLPVLSGLAGASGGTSAAAMVTCCAHRVADLLPFLGLTAAASFLAEWKVPLMIVGLAFWVAGITLIGWRIVSCQRKHRHEETL